MAEGFTIPTYKYLNYAIPSGINGVIAGLVPSVFSMWAMKQVAGKKTRREQLIDSQQPQYTDGNAATA